MKRVRTPACPPWEDEGRIVVIARLDGGAGRDELRRLAGCVDHAVTR